MKTMAKYSGVIVACFSLSFGILKWGLNLDSTVAAHAEVIPKLQVVSDRLPVLEEKVRGLDQKIDGITNSVNFLVRREIEKNANIHTN